MSKRFTIVTVALAAVVSFLVGTIMAGGGTAAAFARFTFHPPAAAGAGATGVNRARESTGTTTGDQSSDFPERRASWIARRPAVPSVPMPENTTPAAACPFSAASARKKESIG